MDQDKVIDNYDSLVNDAEIVVGIADKMAVDKVFYGKMVNPHYRVEDVLDEYGFNITSEIFNVLKSTLVKIKKEVKEGLGRIKLNN